MQQNISFHMMHTEGAAPLVSVFFLRDIRLKTCITKSLAFHIQWCPDFGANLNLFSIFFFQIISCSQMSEVSPACLKRIYPSISGMDGMDGVDGWIPITEEKQLECFACSLEVTLPLGVDSREWLKVPDHHPCPSLQRYSFIFNLPVLSHVFCTPFLRHGANPAEGRPPVMMLVFSDVSECAPDLRGRSHVGHTLELGFCCPQTPRLSILLLPISK